jgi:hypothetical protein
MRVQTWMMLLLCVLTSCVSLDDDRTRQLTSEGLRIFGELLDASVQFRQQTGSWPKEPLDLKPLIADPELHLEKAQELFRFQADQRGLELIDRRSGRVMIIISNQSTKERLVLIGSG